MDNVKVLVLCFQMLRGPGEPGPRRPAHASETAEGRSNQAKAFQSLLVPQSRARLKALGIWSDQRAGKGKLWELEDSLSSVELLQKLNFL